MEGLKLFNSEIKNKVYELKKLIEEDLQYNSTVNKDMEILISLIDHILSLIYYLESSNDNFFKISILEKIKKIISSAKALVRRSYIHKNIRAILAMIENIERDIESDIMRSIIKNSIKNSEVIKKYIHKNKEETNMNNIRKF